MGLAILSCASDDNDKTQDTIIGVWKPLRFAEVYTEAGAVVNEYSTCYQQSRLTFSSNGSLNQILFDKTNNGVCLEDDLDNFVDGT